MKKFIRTERLVIKLRWCHILILQNISFRISTCNPSQFPVKLVLSSVKYLTQHVLTGLPRICWHSRTCTIGVITTTESLHYRSALLTESHIDSTYILLRKWVVQPWTAQPSRNISGCVDLWGCHDPRAPFLVSSWIYISWWKTFIHTLLYKSFLP